MAGHSSDSPGPPRRLGMSMGCLEAIEMGMLKCAGKSTTGPRFGRAQSAKVPAHSEVVPTFPSGGQLPALWCTQLCMSLPALNLKPHMAHVVCDAPCFCDEACVPPECLGTVVAGHAASTMCVVAQQKAFAPLRSTACPGYCKQAAT